MPSPELREFIETGIRVLQILRNEMNFDGKSPGLNEVPPHIAKPNGSPPVAEPSTEGLTSVSAEDVEFLFDQPESPEPTPAPTPDPREVLGERAATPEPKKRGRPFSRRTIGVEAQKAINETVKTAASKEKDPEELRDDIVKKCGKHYVGGDKAKKDLIDRFKKTHKLEYMRDMEDEVLPLAQQMLNQLDALDGV